MTPIRLTLALVLVSLTGTLCSVTNAAQKQSQEVRAQVEPGRMEFTPSKGGLPFSQTVQVGQTLYVSGLLGLDDSGKPVPGGIGAETAKALDTLRSILQDKGLAMDRVAKCTVILADIQDFAAMNQVYAAYFPADHLPTRTTFAAKLLLDARIEIECLASF